MKDKGYADQLDAVYANKIRDDKITKCCDIFRGIVRSTKRFLYAQVAVYLLLAYSVFWATLGSKDFAKPVMCVLCPLAGLVLTIVKRDIKGDLIGLGIDVVMTAVFLYFRVMDISGFLFIASSVVIHGVRAEKISCYNRIKDLYGFSRFNSFDICNQVLGDDGFADGIVSSYERAFDDRLMQYERSSHYVPPLFKKVQTISAAAIIAGVAAMVVASSVMGKVKGAQSVTEIGSKTGGSVKGSVTQIFDVKAYGTDSFTEDEFWVSFGGEQVCFVVPKSKSAEFRALLIYQHPEYAEDDLLSDAKPSSKPIAFVGQIVKADDSKYAERKLTVTPQTQQNSDLPFNTSYYIEIYNTGLFEKLQSVGVILMLVGAAAWVCVIVAGSLENKRFNG